MVHRIKLDRQFCDEVLYGSKHFEIRKDDRGYKVGDTIVFIPWLPTYKKPFQHPIANTSFEIRYILRGWGLMPGYVAMQLKETGELLEKEK